MFIKRIAFILLCVVAVGFALHQTLLHFSLQLYLAHTAKRAGYELSYREVRAHPNELVFVSPVVVFGNGKGRFEAQTVKVAYAFHPLSYTLDLDVRCSSPEIELQSNALNLESMLKSAFTSSYGMTINGSLKFEDGLISLNEGQLEQIIGETAIDFGDQPLLGQAEENEQKLQLHFQMEQSFGQSPTTYLSLKPVLEQPPEESRDLLEGSSLEALVAAKPCEKKEDCALPDDKSFLEFYFAPQGGYLRSKQVDTVLMAHLLHALFPSLQKWSIANGTMEGDLTFTLNEGRLVDGSGELLIKNLSLLHKGSRIHADLKDASLKLFPADGSLAELNFNKGTLIFAEDAPYGRMHQLKGTFFLTKDYQLKVFSDGIWNADNQDSYAAFDASLYPLTLKGLELNLNLLHLEAGHTPSSIAVIADRLDEDESTVEMQFSNLRPREFGFAQRVLNNTFPDVNPIAYVSGTLNGALKLGLHQRSLAHFAAEKIDAENLFMIIKPLELALGAERMQGRFDFDLSALNPEKTVNAAISVKNGQIALTEINFNLWNFTDIQTTLQIINGDIQTSSAQVQLAGLKGNAELLGYNAKEFMRLELKGKASDLLPFVSERMQKGIGQTLASDDVILTASLNPKEKALQVNGSFAVKSKRSEDSPPVTFGFKIQKAPAQGPYGGVLNSNEGILRNALVQALPKLTPAFIAPHQAIQRTMLHQNLGFSGLTLTEGWFKTGAIPLDKFIGPFLFPEKEMQLSGAATIVGTFDLSGVNVHYNFKNLVLENEKLVIESPKIDQSENFFSAYHTIDFLAKSHYGVLPLKGCSYFDKSTGLLFTDISTTIVFEGEKVHADEIETFSNGIYFAGTADLDLSNPAKGYFDVDVRAHTMEGSFTQAQLLFTHFDQPFFFTNIPLQGNLGFGPKGLKLFFAVKPEDYDFQTEIDCALSNGSIKCPNADLALHDLNFNFLFNRDQNTLEFADLQGMLLLGKGNKIEEYSLHAPKISFSDFDKNIADFDLWVKDQTSEFIRVAGSTSPIESKEPNAVAFNFDLDKTHLGDQYPQKMEFVLANWDRVELLQLGLDFRLSSLLHDLQKFSRSGLFFLTHDFLESLNHLKTVGGEFSLEMDYEGQQDTLGFNLIGSGLMLDQYHIKQFALHGYKKDKRWLIEQLQMDQASIAAEFFKDEDLWKIDFLGLRFGQGFLIGLDGEYRQGDTNLHANINLIETDLAQISEWELLKPFMEDAKASGQIKGVGRLELKKDPLKGWQLASHIDTALRKASLFGYNFGDTDHLNLSIDSHGITVKDWKGVLFLDSNLTELAFNLNKLNYEFGSEAFHVDDLKFSVDAASVPVMSQRLSERFPEAFDKKTIELVNGLKRGGNLSGNLQLRKSPSEDKIHLELADGNYFLFGEEHNFKNVTVYAEDDEVTATALTQLNELPLWVSSRTVGSQPGQGELIIAETLSDDSELAPLKVVWKNDPHSGMVIQSAQGNLTGLTVNLTEDLEHPTSAEAYRLTGTVDVNGLKARKIFPPALIEAVTALEMGSGYQVQGQFEIARDAPHGSDRDVRFFGNLNGKNIELKGYRFQRLSSQVIYEPSSFQLLDFNLSDPAGTMYIANIQAHKINDAYWEMGIPLATIHELRPSLLKEVGKPDPKSRKPLVVREIFVQDLRGYLGSRDSFTAHGIINFVNPQKKNLQNILFTVPAEILTRIGLNLSVLTPVTGTIHYELQNSLVHLTKFKDVYSDGKISKFYLASSGNTSTIDLDGNIDVHVRFKQSTLLLKLAEMFQINVKGNLKKPQYALQRQKYFIKKEEVFATSEDDVESLPMEESVQ